MLKDWRTTTLGEIANWASGGTPSRRKSEYFTGTIPWIKTGELTDKYIRDSEEKITEEAVKNSSAKIFPAGSVGIAMYGATIGKLSIFAIDASTNQACAVAQPVESLLYNEFLYYYLLSERKALIDSGKGGAQPNISQGLLKSWPILLPTLKEQHDIVAKIEELFSELDSGIVSLKTAKQQLGIYRQSLLKHAFEGKLTEQWRKDNPDKLENPEQLLARIQQEREARYQQQLEKWQQAVKDWEAQGKEGRIPRKPAKFKNTEPLSLNEISELAPIPDSWIWHRFGSFYEMLSGFAFKKSDYSESGVRLFQIANVGFGKTIWESTAYLPENFKDMYQNLILEEGDLVMALNRPMLGDSLKVAILGKQDCPSILYQRVGKFSFNNYSISKYFLYFLQSSHFTSKLKNELRGVNIPFINQTRLAEYSLPYCSFAEQQEIVNQLEEKLSIIEQNEKEIEAALAKVELLRQSILKKAFSGRLV